MVAMTANVSEEREMSDMFGPNTAQVEAFLALLPGLTEKQWAGAGAAGRDAAWVAARVAAWNAAWDAGRDEAGDAAWVAARVAAWNAAWDAATAAAWGPDWDPARVAAQVAARDAALALVVRDLISQEHFDTLTAPMRAAGVNFDTLGDNGE